MVQKKLKTYSREKCQTDGRTDRWIDRYSDKVDFLGIGRSNLNSVRF